MNDSNAWQLRLFQKTLKKKEKLAIIKHLLPSLKGKRCLDLGCARGTISYFLKQSGGSWTHADLDFENVLATKSLVGASAEVIPALSLPHRNSSFDLIVTLDILEHIHDDMHFVDEMFRVLKPEGVLILSTPATGTFYVINRLKNLCGLPPDQYGHVREGYTLKNLTQMLTHAGFFVQSATTYSRFFTEFVEFLLNLVFVKVLRKKKLTKRDGHISPGSEEEMRTYKKQLRVYSIIYPLVWLFAHLDFFVRWQKGYATLIVAKK